jgi:hypothetical protein
MYDLLADVPAPAVWKTETKINDNRYNAFFTAGISTAIIQLFKVNIIRKSFLSICLKE